MSAIEVIEDGRSAIVLSDRGAAFLLRLDRSQHPPRVTSLENYVNPAPDRDNECLSVLGDEVFFSYEGPAELRRFDGSGLPAHPDFARFHGNGRFEAIAISPDGTIFALAERKWGHSQPFAVYRWRNGK